MGHAVVTSYEFLFGVTACAIHIEDGSSAAGSVATPYVITTDGLRPFPADNGTLRFVGDGEIALDKAVEFLERRYGKRRPDVDLPRNPVVRPILPPLSR